MLSLQVRVFCRLQTDDFFKDLLGQWFEACEDFAVSLHVDRLDRREHCQQVGFKTCLLGFVSETADELVETVSFVGLVPIWNRQEAEEFQNQSDIDLDKPIFLFVRSVGQARSALYYCLARVFQEVAVTYLAFIRCQTRCRADTLLP